MNRYMIGGAMVAIAAATMLPGAVVAGGATVTSGEFSTTPAGVELGYDIGGHATMVRTAAGTTIVVSHPTGLRPRVSYGSHVHNAACSLGGGGHYQHEVGPVDDVNEIWPLVTSNSSGNGRGRATHDHTARDDAQSIVIHEPGSGARIACLDLA